MSRSRRRRPSGADGQDRGSGVRCAGVHLAAGVRLDGGSDQRGASILVCPSGEVQLNDGAAAILRLCDGSRDRDSIVAAIVRTSTTRTMAADVLEFLDAARARGWIVED